MKLLNLGDSSENKSLFLTNTSWDGCYVSALIEKLRFMLLSQGYMAGDY